jgi:signal transduction histidine kinase
VSTGNNLFILDTAALVKGKLSLIEPPNGFKKLANYSVTRMMFRGDMAWQILRDKEYRSIELSSIDEAGFEFKVPLPADITNSIIQQIYVDRENTVWLSNDGEGVFKLVHSPLREMEFPNDKLKKISVYHAFHDGQTTWYSAGDRNLYRLSGNSLEKVKSNLDLIKLFYNNGKKLLGFDTRTVYEGNIEPGVRSITFKPIFTLKNDFFGRKILVDRNENIIAIQEKGLSVWKQGKQIFFLPGNAKEDISDKIGFDKLGRLWSVNRYSGIDVFSLHPENEQQYLKSEIHFPNNMIRGSPRTFVIDKTGKLWIGTRDDGLFVYTPEGNQLVKNFQFHSGNGLTDNFVVELACDSANNIIVGTQTGVDRVVPDSGGTYLIENLSQSRNHYMYIKDTWAVGNYSYALSLFGQVFQIEPALKKNISGPPPLFLEELKINSKVSDPGENIFYYKENNITFQFAAPSFIDEKQVRFSYLLEGTGNDFWSDTASAHSAINLTNLSAGKYLLRVKAFFPTISYPPAEYSYSFKILPPWWQTWWFRLGIAVIAITVLVLGLRFYYRGKLQKQKAELEKQQAIEKERTRIATDMHDDLGAGLSRIKFLSETIGIKQQLSQGVEEEITSIRNYSHEMIDKMGEIVWALNQKNDTLSDLLSYTRAYAVEYLTQHGIECKVQIPDQFPQIFLRGEFRRNIYLTFKEALHNIVKHAQASRVTIRIIVNHSLDIQISDDGKGFDNTAIRTFCNGLVSMESRIRETGGKFSISGNNGTDIHIQVPLLN